VSVEYAEDANLCAKDLSWVKWESGEGEITHLAAAAANGDALESEVSVLHVRPPTL
jgi:hypothetical protein